MSRKARISLVLLWLASAPCVALMSDREQPLNIEADRAAVDDRQGLTVYEGAVVVTQGTIRITADKLKVYFDASHDMEKVVAEGAPARFRQRPDNSQEFIHASARRMEYQVAKNTLFLLDGAEVTQGGDRFSGNRIVYDTHLNRVQARKAESGKERVKITLTPKKKSAPTAPASQ